MDLAGLRDSIQTALQAISGLTVYDNVPPSPIVPCAIIHILPFGPRACMDRTSVDVRLAVQVLVQLADWVSAQDSLDSYVGTGSATSVTDILEKAVIGGATIVVETIEGPHQLTIGETTFAAVSFNVLAML
jgi:hypothetical protein